MSDFWDANRARLFKWGLGFFLGAVLGIFLTFFEKKQYESAASVIFMTSSGGLSSLIGGSGGLPSTSLGPGSTLGLTGRTPTLDIATAVLSSREASLFVATKLNLYSALELHGDADSNVSKIMSRLTVRKKQGNLLSVTFLAPSPELAQKAIYGYFSYYKKYTDDKSLTSSKRLRIYLDKQVEQSRQRLVSMKSSMQQFLKAQAVLLAESEPDLKSKQFSELYGTRVEAEARLAGSSAKLREIEEKLASNPVGPGSELNPQPIDDPVMLRAQGDLVDAKLQRDSIGLARTNLHPEMIRAEKQISNIESRIRERLGAVRRTWSAGLTPQLISASAETKAAQSQIDLLTNELDAMHSKLKLAPEVYLTRKWKEREFDLYGDVHKLLELERNRAAIAENYESPELEILDNPSLPTRSSWPRKSTYALVGGAIGFLISFALTQLNTPGEAT